MKVELKKVKTIDLEYLAFSVLNNTKCHTFEMFLLEYFQFYKGFEDANFYDNWYEIRTSVYNNLFVYCAENDLEDILEKLKKLKDF